MAFFLVVFTSLQAAFLTPDTTLVPGERTNLFTGLLCGVSLISAWLFTEGLEERIRGRGFIISLGLIALAAASILTSPERASAFYRGSVSLSAALGGYWCGRIILADLAWRRLFAWFCMALLAALTAFAIAGLLTHGDINELIPGASKHPLANRIMLLWFAPLLLIVSANGLQKTISVIFLAASYAPLFFSGMRTAVLMPVVMSLSSILLGVLPLRWTLTMAGGFALAATVFFLASPEQLEEITSSEHEEVYYRLESIPFSAHIIAKHPFLGIGLRTQRGPYLHDYDITLTKVGKDRYRHSVEHIVASENSLLSMAVGFGLPFTILYLIALFWTYGCLMISVVRLPSSQSLAMLGLFLPITAGLTYAFLYDAVMYPQVLWFFHLLLGMCPRRPVPKHKDASSIVMGEPLAIGAGSLKSGRSS